MTWRFQHSSLGQRSGVAGDELVVEPLAGAAQ